MCGIFGVVGKADNAAETIFTGLKALEYRGYDSWGVAVKHNLEIKVNKHTGKIGAARIHLPKSTIGVGHTRWATHGGVTELNTHPHLDCNSRLATVHNGIVENHQLLREKLKRRGHRFISETDTEVVAHLIEEKTKSMPLTKAVFAAFNQLEGSNAIVVLDKIDNAIIACRDGSPLVVGLGENEYFISSDVTPFLKATNKVVYLDNGEGVVLKTDGITLYDLPSGKAKQYVVTLVDWKLEDVEKGGFDHFLLKEIMEQKKTIQKTASLNTDEIETLGQKIRGGYNVVFLGCGTAFYCALSAKYFFAQQGIVSETLGAYEYAPFAGFLGKKTIVIAVSQSGETADTLIAAKEAKKRGAYLIALVNARGSTLERLADTVMPVGAGPEIAVVSTKAFTSQLITLYLLAAAAAGKYESALKIVKRLTNELGHWLNNNLQKTIIALVKQIVEINDVYLIGKHENYPAALEVALKIKETSYIHSEAFASGELKHGVITLIQKGTPCLVLASNDRVKQEILSSAAELKARGGYIIGIAPFKAVEFDYHIQTPDAEELTIIPNIIVGQLLGYYLGIGRGADPDKPRNLAKSVTVK